MISLDNFFLYFLEDFWWDGAAMDGMAKLLAKHRVKGNMSKKSPTLVIIVKLLFYLAIIININVIIKINAVIKSIWHGWYGFMLLVQNCSTINIQPYIPYMPYMCHMPYAIYMPYMPFISHICHIYQMCHKAIYIIHDKLIWWQHWF